MGSTRSAARRAGSGVVLAVVSEVAAAPTCAVTALAVANHYIEASWPIAFTILYFAVGVAWLALVATTVSGRLRLIATAPLTVLVLLVGLLTHQLSQLT